MTLIVSLFLTTFAFVSSTELTRNARQNEMCNVTVYSLRSDHSPRIVCDCRDSSAQCLWTTFANREDVVSNGTQLMWQGRGYGQYVCVGDNSTVLRNVLILPESED